MNEGLFSAYSALPQWKELLARVKARSCVAVGGLSEGERPFFAAAVAHRTGRPVVLISPTELTAQKQAQDITRLTGESAAMLPTRDVQFSRAAASQESTWQRLGVLEEAAAGRLRILCLSAEGALDRCCPVERFRSASLSLNESQTISPTRLVDRLVQNGYERVPMVEGKGQCAIRGDILDVFPPNETDAIRIEFFGDEVDTIRRFDCISQRSIARVKEVRLGPATECIPDHASAAADRLEAAYRAVASVAVLISPSSEAGIPTELSATDSFLAALDQLDEENEAVKEMAATAILDADAKAKGKPTHAPRPVDTLSAEQEREAQLKRHLDDVQRVRDGHPIRTAPMWMNVLCPDACFATDYLTDPIVLVDQPDQLQIRVKTKRDAFLEEWQEAARRGDGFDAQRNLLYTYDDLLASFAHRSVTALSDLTRGLGRLNPEAALTWQSEPVMPYQSRLEPLCKDIAGWKEQGMAIVLLTGGEARGRRLLRSLAEQGTPATYAETLDGNLIAGEVILLPVSFSKGFRNTEAGLCLVADSDLFGTSYQRAKKRQNAGERIASFTDLKPGDFVVHDIHGVGIFDGVVQLNTEGVTRDYLLIRYLGNDKLYVPTDQFDRVQKFIGAEHSAPKLNRLGGGEWERQKSKVKAGLKKLAFDLAELYAARQRTPGYAFSHETPWQREFEDMFPYELTADQQQCVEQIFADMESPRNMDRLLCGDVGYGKTEVALRAAFKAVLDGKQVAILAPTTILVQQHLNTVKKRFAGFPVTFDMLSRFRSPKEQKEIIQRLKDGKIDLLIGTHRILAKDVQFRNLGLLIVDEEQRFGVNHKEAIKHIKTTVDVLTLSATPIPRTLHMSMVGIRDMSILETPPEERMPVKTYVAPYDEAMIAEAIRREINRGGQVYFLYNRVRTIGQMFDRLKTLVPEARIGVAHGQMRENALEDVMLDFYAGAFDVLLCTTIIESGLDVPEANTLIVFDADRFGLSQLYQIRGRVGRSNRQAYAYFTIRRDKLLSETAEKRLSAIREFTEFGAGYRIAMRDLEIRGAGDVLGPEQHGHLSTVGYDMYVKLIEQAVGEAQGREEIPELDTRVELAVNAFLPADFVPDEKMRIEIYKRIAMIEDQTSRINIEEELIDRFGDIPEPVKNLISIAQLRAVTRKLGVNHLFLRPDGLHLRLDNQYMPDPIVLYTAAADTDPRLVFSLRQPPEMLLRQADMSAETAMALGIDLLTKMHNHARELTEQKKAEQQTL
ncbi:MAG TPA: transcription-repair coupling factor [Candidatus Limiplasma sp.]|mgnify:CR=1 FL=1|nr:transcription-repair coupling factor [Candidatus Limiplasma sp.]